MLRQQQARGFSSYGLWIGREETQHRYSVLSPASRHLHPSEHHLPPGQGSHRKGNLGGNGEGAKPA